MSDPELPPLYPVEPDDAANRELLSNVHPAEWRNPEPRPRYHLVVVGGGTAGLVTAAGAAGLGARVALVERHLLGGDCLNVGCVPSKAIVRAARAWHEARTGAARFGAPETAAGAAGDFAAAMARMRRLRARLSGHDGARRFRDLGVDVFLGDGRFVSPGEVEVTGPAGSPRAGARLAFRSAVVATGARAAVPEVAGLAEAGYLTNETLFNLTALPARLAVLGAGPIGCEMAQAFARFGSRVTLVCRDRQILPREDADAAAVVARALAADGVELALGWQPVAVRREGEVRTIVLAGADDPQAKRDIEADAILVATGRAPNVEGLGLDAAGVRHSSKGVLVDDRLRTTNRRIFACGDVASRFQFTHMADAQARIVVQNALFALGPLGSARASALTVPWCTYTAPEVAHVGMYEADAKAKGIAVETLTVPLAEVDRAVLEGDDAGFLRVHLRRGSDEILGATLVAERAGDAIAEVCLAMTKRIGLGAIASVVHPYPTEAEVVRKAADLWRRGKLTPAVKRTLGWWLRVRR
jgi:pyruvate/2-oxoglutarate dehydrogenase complex dihydrolipoamide dehydrogenase (E3) component